MQEKSNQQHTSITREKVEEIETRKMIFMTDTLTEK
jgi:hypothetical protein